MVEVQLAGACVRAREWACKELDGELSDFEGLLLKAHVVRCNGCGEFSAEIAAITHHLRSTPAERLARSFALPPRRRLLHNHKLLAAVATVAVSATGLAATLTLGDVSRQLQPTNVETITSESTVGSDKDLIQLRVHRVAQLRPSAIHAAANPRRGLQL